MPESTLITLLGIISPILTSLIGFVLGKRYERHKQALIIRSEMLKPIEEWLSGAEKMIGIFSDTLVSVTMNSSLSVTYSLDERRKAAQFMSEKTNIVLGILNSKSLQIWQTRKTAKQLHETIIALDALIKYQLLPLDMQISGTPTNDILSPGLVAKVSNLKTQLDVLLQSAHSLTAKIKLSLT
jgi:hypothetical protein